jgi:hypothetical protein
MKIALLLAAVLALPLHAAEIPSAKLARDLEGAYQGGGADAVDVVRHDDEHLFVRASLTGENGRHCGFTGIAAYENGAFVYHDPNQTLSGKQACMLTVAARGDGLQLSDRAVPKGPSTCSVLCGGRGGLGDYAIAMSKKTAIRSVPKLKASKDYVQAVKAFEAAQQ